MTAGEPGATRTDGDADALKAAGDIIKVSTGLATGALVFSISLLPNVSDYVGIIRYLIAGSWGLLLISIIAGVCSQSAIPVLLFDREYDIENKYYTWPGRVHQVAFGFAILFLSIALCVILLSASGKLRVPTAADAVTNARYAIQNTYDILKLEKIELIKAPSNRPDEATWHAQFEVAKKAPGKVFTPIYLDVIIGARKGNVAVVQ